MIDLICHFIFTDTPALASKASELKNIAAVSRSWALDGKISNVIPEQGEYVLVFYFYVCLCFAVFQQISC